MTMHVKFGRWFPALAAILLASACATEPSIPEGSEAEMSFDGLVKVKNSVMDETWVKPGLDLSGYNKILPVRTEIEYRAVKPVSKLRSMQSSTTEFPLTDLQKASVEQAVSEVFGEEGAKSKYFTITDTPDAGTLILIGKLFDVVSNVPPELMGRGDIYLNRIGEASLALELRDAQSGEILARSVDRRAIDPAFVRASNPVTNKAEFKRVLRSWATNMREKLDKLHETYDQ